MAFNDLLEIADKERFGFRVGQRVKITEESEFKGQETEIIAFTPVLVIVTVFGPTGEPDSEWWFEPKDLEPLDQSFAT